jgi:hypothetical protein
VSAYIEGSGSEGVNASGISLRAEDNSQIDAVAGTTLVSAAFSLSNASSNAFGLSFAGNLIDTRSSAYIKNAPGIYTGGGDVVIMATDFRQIFSEASAAAFTGSLGLFEASSLTGGGSWSMNTVLGYSKAYIEESVIGSVTAPVGAVDIDAVSNAEIWADIASAAAAVSLSGSPASAYSIGLAVAMNWVGDFFYGVSGDPLQVSAWIKNSDVQANGAITVDAVANQDIDAEVDAGAVSMSASAANPSLPDISLLSLILPNVFDLLFGVTHAGGLSAAGILSHNSVESIVSAFIDGNGTDGINAAEVQVRASDQSTIDAVSEAVAVSATISLGASSSKSFGAGWADNLIDTNSSAYIIDVTDIDTDGGDVVVSAADTREIVA